MAHVLRVPVTATQRKWVEEFSKGDAERWVYKILLPQIVTVQSGSVIGITCNGVVATSMVAGVFTVGPGNAIVVSFTVAPIMYQHGTGLLLYSTPNITPHGSLAGNTAGSKFGHMYVTGCSAGYHFAGTPSPQHEVTNLSFVHIEQDTFGVTAGTFGVGMAISNNEDSLWFGRVRLAIGAHTYGVGLAVNTYTPTAAAVNYQDTIELLTVDATSQATQFGVQMGSCESVPFLVRRYIPQPSLPPINLVSLNTHFYMKDEHNSAVYAQSGTAFFANVWHPQSYPGNLQPFTNPTEFTIMMLVVGGTVTEIDQNNANTGLTAGIFILKPGDTLTCTSSMNPATYAAQIIGL